MLLSVISPLLCGVSTPPLLCAVGIQQAMLHAVLVTDPLICAVAAPEALAHAVWAQHPTTF